MRKLFALNSNPAFRGMWDWQEALSKKFGVQATLLFTGSMQEFDRAGISLDADNVGRVYQWKLVFSEGVNPARDWRVPCMLAWFAAQFPGEEPVYLSGIDQFQLGGDPYIPRFIDREARESAGVCIPLAGGYPERRGPGGFTYYPSGLLSASPGTFRRLLEPLGSAAVHSADAYLSAIWHNRNRWPSMFPGSDYWGLDEAYLSWAIHETGISTWAPRDFFSEFVNRRFDRARQPGAPASTIGEWVDSGKFWELHACRPLSDFDKTVLKHATR